MKNLVIALSSLAFFLSSVSLQADSLSDIYQLALQNDAQLKSEEAVYLARRETENLSRSALLPQVGASYSYQNSDGDTDGLGPIFSEDGIIIDDTFTNRDINTEGYVISLNQTLFDLSAWFSFQSGKQVTKEAEATFAANQQNLIVRVVEAYLLVLRAQDNLAASQAQERAFERQLEQTQQRFEVGYRVDLRTQVAVVGNDGGSGQRHAGGLPVVWARGDGERPERDAVKPVGERHDGATACRVPRDLERGLNRVRACRSGELHLVPQPAGTEDVVTQTLEEPLFRRRRQVEAVGDAIAGQIVGERGFEDRVVVAVVQRTGAAEKVDIGGAVPGGECGATGGGEQRREDAAVAPDVRFDLAEDVHHTRRSRGPLWENRSFRRFLAIAAV